MDMDETAQECAMRELTEETGLTVTETLQVVPIAVLTAIREDAPWA